MPRIKGDEDPFRLAVAAHELGHVIAFERAGLTIKSIAVWGYGPESQGLVRVGRQMVTDVTQARLYLVGLLTGRIAELRWCRLNNLEFRPERTCREDVRAYRKLRRQKLVRHIAHRDIVAEAGQLVRGNWKRIARPTPKLAAKGHLNV